MHKVRFLVLFLSTLALASSASAPAGATVTKRASSITKLQVAAGDLARETTNRDRRGVKRAFREFTKVYKADRGLIESKATHREATTIARDVARVTSALKAGNLRRASRYAGRLLKAVNAAAATISPTSVAHGTALLLNQLKSAARDIQEEAHFRDRDGTHRAVGAFAKLFKASKHRIAARAGTTASRITATLKKTRADAKRHSFARVHADARRLAREVDRGIAIVKAHDG